MADRLSATMIADLVALNIHTKQTFQAWIKGTGAGTVDISAFVLSYGSLSEMQLFNKHPKEPGNITYPTMEIVVDNRSGYFDVGSASGIFPGGEDDFSRLAQLQVKAFLLRGAESKTVLNYTGYISQPESNERATMTIFAEHPLNAMTKRKFDENDFDVSDTGWNVSLNI